MGEILKAVYEQQLDGVVTTLEDAIDAREGDRRRQRAARQRGTRS